MLLIDQLRCAITTVTLDEAKRLLEELQKGLKPGSSVLIVHDGQPVAQLMQQGVATPAVPSLGFWKGKLEIVAEDEEHLRDFADYMP
ncbi:hypothetical protein K2X85_12070 [bacterium]|nr:hypothetical protein [bacterium]